MHEIAITVRHTESSNEDHSPVTINEDNAQKLNKLSSESFILSMSLRLGIMPYQSTGLIESDFQTFKPL